MEAKMFKLSVALCCLAVMTAPGQDTRELLKLSLEELMDVEVVTASKTPRPASDITQKVDVVTDAQMERTVLGNRNLAELIQYLPAASVKVLSRNDANWGAYGGIGPKYSTFMVQGLPVDAFIDPQSLDAMAIQRIEIQRGPASVLYPNYLSQDFAGNQSPLAGTVNLILKEEVAGPKTKVLLGGGSYKTYSGQAYHENYVGKVNVLSGISYEKSDYTDYGTPDSWLNMQKNPEYQKGKAFLGANLHLDKAKKHSIVLFGNHTAHWGDAGRVNREFNNQYSLMNAGYSGQLTKNIIIALKAGARYYQREYQEDNYTAAVPDTSLKETDGVEQLLLPNDLSLTFKHWAGSTFTVGLDNQHAVYSTWQQPAGQTKTTGNDATAEQLGLYSQEELRLDKFILRGGLRFNCISYDIEKIGGVEPGKKDERWNVLLWSGGAKYQLTKSLTFFTNAGNSFMSPSLKSIGGTIPLSRKNQAGWNGQLPNPDLKPENGQGFDFGGDYQLPGNVFLSARAFYTVITDAIIDNDVSTDSTHSQTMSFNARGKTVGKGFEFSVRQQIAQAIDWFANVTYTKSAIADPDNPDQDGVEVPFVPEIMNNLGLTLYLPFDVEVSPWVHLGGRIFDSNSKTGRKAYDSKELVNVSVSKRIKLGGNKNLRLFADAYNVTDNRFDMPWQFRDPGFALNAGARVEF
jgi:iron complex outermembrane recepter protein